MNKKCTNKDLRVTVRLTPNQARFLDEITKESRAKKSKIIRYALDDLIKRCEK